MDGNHDRSDLVAQLAAGASPEVLAAAVCGSVAHRADGRRIGAAVMLPDNPDAQLRVAAASDVPSWLVDSEVPLEELVPVVGRSLVLDELVTGPTAWSTTDPDRAVLAAVPIEGETEPLGVVVALGPEELVDASCLLRMRAGASLLALASDHVAADRPMASTQPSGPDALFSRLSSLGTSKRRLGSVVGLMLVTFDLALATNDVDLEPALGRAVRPTDTVIPLEPRTFAVICGHLADPVDLAVIGERVRTRMRDGTLGIKVSVGGAVGHAPLDPPALLQAATAASLIARDRASVHVVDLAQGASVLHVVDRQTVLRAIERGEIRPHYQPVLDLRTERITGAEALARWERPDGTIVPPKEFVPLLEETGGIQRLTRSMLLAACRDLVAWRSSASVDDGFSVSVNVSATELGDDAIVELVAEVLQLTGAPAANLRLEITETTAFADRVVATEVLASLRGLGVSLAVDDFGTGYATLASLRKLPVQSVKIDRGFVSGLPDRHNEAIIGAIIDLARPLGLKVVAEGVETEDELRVVRAAGADAVQGYFVARALPATALVAFIAAHQG